MCYFEGLNFCESVKNKVSIILRQNLLPATEYTTYTVCYENFELYLPVEEFFTYTCIINRYMVGVLDKEKGIMELHKADIFHMTPYIKGILFLMHVFLIKLFAKIS